MAHTIIWFYLFTYSLVIANLAYALPAEWVEHKPGGKTLCARGTPFSFFVKHGDQDKVVIDFMGGGACWDSETCKEGSPTFIDSIDAFVQDMADGKSGVYDLSNPDNPYKGWTHVIVPYCTGDIHWGNRDIEYNSKSGEVTKIYHRGAENSKAVIEWVTKKYQMPEKVLVAGCSAGSYGSIYWVPHIKESYPFSTVMQLGDSGAGVMTQKFMENNFSVWRGEDNAATWIPAIDPQSKDWTRLTLNDLYVAIADYYPDVRLSQYNTSNDITQQLFYILMGGNPLSWSSKMQNTMKSLGAATDQFNYYIDKGFRHCSTRASGFYSIKSRGVYLHQWVKDLIDEVDLTSIDM